MEADAKRVLKAHMWTENTAVTIPLHDSFHRLKKSTVRFASSCVMMIAISSALLALPLCRLKIIAVAPKPDESSAKPYHRQDHREPKRDLVRRGELSYFHYKDPIRFEVKSISTPASNGGTVNRQSFFREPLSGRSLNKPFDDPGSLPESGE